DGRYWQGGVWAPTNYMVIAGLRQNNLHPLAFELAKKHHQQVLQVFKDTGTFWEYYAPETTTPGLLARPDFIGWTGLVPISILFEGIFGIRSSIQTNTINWDVRLTEEHGIDRYPIGKEGILSLQAAARTSEKQKPSLTIQSNLPLKLKLSWAGGSDTFDIKPGMNKI
ncbi:MAG: hypothetical protein MUE38_08425, partial [Flavihumibacter sp.]|nr:hypothetical protein [Flavihumibacter sp.]